MNNKTKLIVFSLLVLIVLILIICWTNEGFKKDNGPETWQGNTQENQEVQEKVIRQEDDGTKINISEKIQNASFVIDELRINNIKITELAGKTDMIADVINNTDSDAGDVELNIVFLNKSGETIIEMGGYIGIVEAGKTAKINASVTGDYAEVYDIKIEKR